MMGPPGNPERFTIECAGFTPGEADQLRRAMATFKLTGGVSRFATKLVDGMVARGYSRDFAQHTFKQLEGFGSYGFPESHAASFALIAYASSWMKCHHPEVFTCALLNAQPMGFYAPAQIVRDARDHGVEVRPVDVNASRWDCTLEPTGQGRLAVRLGFRLVRGLANAAGAGIVAAREDRPYGSVEDLWRRAGAPVAALRQLAAADAFAGMELTRREAAWAIRELRDEALPLFAAAGAAQEAVEPEVTLRPMAVGSEVVEDYTMTGLSLRSHPIALLRQDLRGQGCIPCAELARTRDGRRVTVSGLVLVRQRPGSANGVLFITLEDETGIANVIVWKKLFEQRRRVVLGASMMAVKGRVQIEGEVIHLIADDLKDHSELLCTIRDKH
jgi:error-prone DNA polymerase